MISAKKNMVKKTTLKNKADKLVSEIVRLSGQCERCGNTNYLQCAHIVGRNNHTLRFDLMNVLCLCAGCHRWGHDNPIFFSEWVKEKYPARFEYLMHNANQLTKRTLSDYEELCQGLQKVYNKKRLESILL